MARRCSTRGCDRPARPRQRHCRPCATAYMRVWRAKQQATWLAYRAIVDGLRA